MSEKYTDTRTTRVMNNLNITVAVPTENGTVYVKPKGAERVVAAPATLRMVRQHLISVVNDDDREVPVRPASRLIKDGDHGPYCPMCGSSQRWWLGLFGKMLGLQPEGCINEGCPLYHAREPVMYADEVASTESGEILGG